VFFLLTLVENTQIHKGCEIYCAMLKLLCFWLFPEMEKLKKPRRCTSCMSAGLLKLYLNW